MDLWTTKSISIINLSFLRTGMTTENKDDHWVCYSNQFWGEMIMLHFADLYERWDPFWESETSFTYILITLLALRVAPELLIPGVFAFYECKSVTKLFIKITQK